MSTYAMRFRKPWLRVKSVNFDFSAKSSSTDHNELNKATPKSLAHMESEKLFVEHGVPKNKLFPIFHSIVKFPLFANNDETTKSRQNANSV